MRWVLAAFAVCFALAGGFGLATADQGLQTRHAIINGVPLREVSAPGTAVLRPGVVVAHGFAGSARLMAGFGESLARRGFTVVLLDFNGHGANSRRPFDLQGNLDTAVSHLRTLPGVDPQRLSLIGHSMGAGAVTRYAATHPEIASTVAISLPSAAELAAESPSRLLLLVGALEFPGFHEAARQAVQASPQRRAVTLPGVEHISILYAPKAHEEILAWLGAPTGPPPTPANRALAGVALLAAFGLAFPLLASLLLGHPANPSGHAAPPAHTNDAAPPAHTSDAALPVHTSDAALLVHSGDAALPVHSGGAGSAGWAAWRNLGWVAAAVAVAAIAAAVVPLGWMPIAVTSYVAALMAVAGAALMLAARWRRQAKPVAEPRSRVRLTVSAIFLCGYSAVAIALPLHLGVTHAVPTPPRLWLLALTVAAFAWFSYGVLRWCGGRFWVTATAFGIAVVVLTGAAMTGLAPGFLLLVVPLFAVLMAWQAGWSATLTRLAAPAWLTATVGACLPALAAAVAMPLI